MPVVMMLLHAFLGGIAVCVVILYLGWLWDWRKRFPGLTWLIVEPEAVDTVKSLKGRYKYYQSEA